MAPQIGLDPLSGGAAQYRAMIEAERAIDWPLIRELGLRLD